MAFSVLVIWVGVVVGMKFASSLNMIDRSELKQLSYFHEWSWWRINATHMMYSIIYVH